MITMQEFDAMTPAEKSAYIKTLEKKLARMFIIRMSVSLVIAVGVPLAIRHIQKKKIDQYNVTPTE